MSLWLKKINNIYKIGLNIKCLQHNGYQIDKISILSNLSINKNQPLIEIKYYDNSNIILNSNISGYISDENTELINDTNTFVKKLDDFNEDNLWLLNINKDLHFNGLYYENVSINSSEGSKSLNRSSSS